MTNDLNPNERVGWELIWRGEAIPPQYRSSAPPQAAVVEWADTLPPGGFVLDVGCGLGRHCIYLGGRGFRVAGVDISPSGIHKTQEVCAENQIAFEGHVSDMDSLPWADKIFDGALSISTMHHHLRQGIVQSIAEVWRVLKPGGLLVVDFPCTDTVDYQNARKQVDAGQLVEVEPNTFVDERPELDDSDDGFLPHHFCDEAEVRDLLHSFDMLRLWADLREIVTEKGSVRRGKWVAWARRPLTS